MILGQNSACIRDCLLMVTDCLRASLLLLVLQGDVDDHSEISVRTTRNHLEYIEYVLRSNCMRARL